MPGITASNHVSRRSIKPKMRKNLQLARRVCMPSKLQSCLGDDLFLSWGFIDASLILDQHLTMTVFTHLPNNRLFYRAKLKAIADDIQNKANFMVFVCEKVKNNIVKGL